MGVSSCPTRFDLCWVLPTRSRWSSGWWSRAVVAANPSTNDETFAALAADSDAVVRACVGANHAAPPEILVGLAGDSEMSVRVAVTRNPSAPADAISAAVR